MDYVKASADPLDFLKQEIMFEEQVRVEDPAKNRYSVVAIATFENGAKVSSEHIEFAGHEVEYARQIVWKGLFDLLCPNVKAKFDDNRKRCQAVRDKAGEDAGS